MICDRCKVGWLPETDGRQCWHCGSDEHTRPRLGTCVSYDPATFPRTYRGGTQ